MKYIVTVQELTAAISARRDAVKNEGWFWIFQLEDEDRHLEDVTLDSIGSVESELFSAMMADNGFHRDGNTIHFDTDGLPVIYAEAEKVFNEYNGTFFGGIEEMRATGEEVKDKAHMRSEQTMPTWDKYQLQGDDHVDYHGGHVTDTCDLLKWSVEVGVARVEKAE